MSCCLSTSRLSSITRARGDQWVLTELAGVEAVLRLPSIRCDLPLSAIYERVVFTPDPEMPMLEFWQTQAQDREETQ